ncbi:MAG TPA: hypothetical protein PLO37_09785 [Candidatus Hydrogenedentes bacterium]|nr:hypothetical protein [Candidatus Hydrogenedentota bacterium]HPG67123.1 hypothetical protein [Candidatus Hydrogenedentota bacterium]
MDIAKRAGLMAGLIVLLAAGTGWAGSVTIDFSGIGLANEQELPAGYEYSGFTFNYDGTTGWHYGATYGVGGTPEIYTDEFNFGATEVRLKRTDGMEFYFYDCQTRGPFGDFNIDFYGYRDGIQVQGPATVFCGAEFATNTFNWQNVDEVRILKHGAEEFSFDFDNFRYDNAPTVKSVQVVNSLNVDVTFNKPVTTGQLDAANYALSGTGQGTLPAHPTSVVSQGGNTYRLTWTSGHMSFGGNITITVANVLDASAQGMGTPNSGTHTGGALPVELSTFAIE